MPQSYSRVEELPLNCGERWNLYNDISKPHDQPLQEQGIEDKCLKTKKNESLVENLVLKKKKGKMKHHSHLHAKGRARTRRLGLRREGKSADLTSLWTPLSLAIIHPSALPTKIILSLPSPTITLKSLPPPS